MPSHPAGDKTFILIVDDEPGMRSVMRRILATEGYESFEAGSAAEAQAWLLQHEAQLVAAIIDLNLPDDSTGEFLRAFLAEDSPAPALVVSGDSDHPLLRKNPEIPFLSKPFEPKALIEAMQRLRTQQEKGVEG